LPSYSAMKQTASDYTTDELICACIARQIEDGEAVAQGIATPLVAAGYIRAKLTHAPQHRLPLRRKCGSCEKRLTPWACAGWNVLAVRHVGLPCGRSLSERNAKMTSDYQTKDHLTNRPNRIKEVSQ
jgi:hypothetical protein